MGIGDWGLGYYVLVMEYVNGGSLSECLVKYKQKYKASFPEEIVQHIMRQIINAFVYIHGHNIMHRDIKLENIMINYNNINDKNNLNILRGRVKVIDFGLAINGFGKTVVGSPLTMDPLILEKYKKSLTSKISKDLIYDLKADIWSLGVICYQMLIGKSVFDAKSLDELVKKVEEGTYLVPTSISREIVSFLNSMLQYISEKRLSAEKLERHPFLTRNIRDFHKIDIKKVSKKIDNNQLNINVKKNTTIWSIFNKADESKLLSIQGDEESDTHNGKNNSMGSMAPSTFNSNGSGKSYSVISNNSNISNSHFIPKIDYYHNFNPNAWQVSGSSFYGQSMHKNNQNPFGMQNQNIGIQQQQIALGHNNTYPYSGMNNNANLYQNIPGPGNQFYYRGNEGVNNLQNSNIPFNNDESTQRNVCFIM